MYSFKPEQIHVIWNILKFLFFFILFFEDIKIGEKCFGMKDCWIVEQFKKYVK